MCASRRLVGVLEYVLFSTSLNLIPTSPETGGLKLGCSLPNITIVTLHYVTLHYNRYITKSSPHSPKRPQKNVHYPSVTNSNEFMWTN